MDEPGFTLQASLADRRLEIAGELDLATSSTLRSALADLADGNGDVTGDMSAVTFAVERVLHLAGLFTVLDVQSSAG